MNISEIIALIEKLPLEEQKRILEHVKNLVEREVLHDEPSVRYMDAEKAKAVSSEIFSEHATLFRKLAS